MTPLFSSRTDGRRTVRSRRVDHAGVAASCSNALTVLAFRRSHNDGAGGPCPMRRRTKSTVVRPQASRQASRASLRPCSTVVPSDLRPSGRGRVAPILDIADVRQPRTRTGRAAGPASRAVGSWQDPWLGGWDRSAAGPFRGHELRNRAIGGRSPGGWAADRRMRSIPVRTGPTNATTCVDRRRRGPARDCRPTNSSRPCLVVRRRLAGTAGAGSPARAI